MMAMIFFESLMPARCCTAPEIPHGHRALIAALRKLGRNDEAIEALVELMFAASDSQPLMFTIEDLHWVDPTTLEFLTVLIDQR